MPYPKRVKIVEVGPRDGFQNIPTPIPTTVKLNVIRSMIAAGISKMEITSFVHPKAVPQMADAMDIAKTIISQYAGSSFEAVALVPNLTGATNAHNAGIRHVTYVISASEKHNFANTNRTTEQSLTELQTIRAKYPDLSLQLGLATSFGCPFSGPVDDELVLELARSALTFGVNSVLFADTIGVANPRQVTELVIKAKDRFPATTLALHLHDTRGMGLANMMAGLEAGIDIFETSIGGLGGCPFAPGAAGNTATEDAVNMLHAVGIDTGIDLNHYLEAVQLVRQEIKNDLTSHMACAHKYENL